ncbi:bacillithiol system redox-active protein YtxJ [uncultured Kriegella sp.]|uniref:bacillithiol system redox-active protein YtxJ n=1 Tax=uncultured Kriegella sp. TaxID=1798910 RepID=UPI0030D8EEF4|tara:strand:- start:340525 stop:340920 length:396 start_codon:yes stop_codon:yes gene_type:complete
MGVFDSLFGKKNLEPKKEGEAIPWIPLVSLEQLNEIEKKSHTKPQAIFKHSTTCGISRMVLNMFKQNYHFSANEMDMYFLDLHRNREVSNEVGYKFQVMHQSPQLLVIKDGTVVAHDSHGAITDIDLGKYL